MISEELETVKRINSTTSLAPIWRSCDEMGTNLSEVFNKQQVQQTLHPCQQHLSTPLRTLVDCKHAAQHKCRAGLCLKPICFYCNLMYPMDPSKQMRSDLNAVVFCLLWARISCAMERFNAGSWTGGRPDRGFSVKGKQTTAWSTHNTSASSALLDSFPGGTALAGSDCPTIAV